MGDVFKSRVVDDLANGQPISPGEEFTLAAKDQNEPHNERLIKEDRIFKLPSSKGGDDK